MFCLYEILRVKVIVLKGEYMREKKLYQNPKNINPNLQTNLHVLQRLLKYLYWCLHGKIHDNSKCACSEENYWELKTMEYSTRGVQKIKKLSETPAKLCMIDSKKRKINEKIVSPVALHPCRYRRESRGGIKRKSISGQFFWLMFHPGAQWIE